MSSHENNSIGNNSIHFKSAGNNDDVKKSKPLMTSRETDVSGGTQLGKDTQQSTVHYNTGTNRRSRRWTKRERCLVIVLSVFVILCLLLVSIIITISIKGSSSNSICTSRQCVLTAANILEAIDPTVDPCEDFFQYACGAWNKNHVIPEDKSGYNTFENLHDQLQIVLKKLLTYGESKVDTEATRQAKTLYASCVNLTAIEKVGDVSLKRLIEELGGWPVLEKPNVWRTRTESKGEWRLERLLGDLRKYNMPILIESWVGADDKNSTKNIIQLDQAKLGMPSREYYLSDTDGESKAAYLKYMIAVAQLLGADPARATSQMNKVFEFETDLAELTLPQSERHDTSLLYTKMTISELQYIAPQIDWLLYLNSFMPMNITKEEEVVVLGSQYLTQLAALLVNKDKELLTNYVIWRLLHALSPELPQEYLDKRSDYRKVITGVSKEPTRWQKCVDLVNERMGMALGRLFVSEHFQKESKDNAVQMIRSIRKAFVGMLEESNWMDEEAKIVAIEKANAIQERIGYPEYILNNKELDKIYDGLTFKHDRYFDNVISVELHDSLKELKKLRDPIIKDKWEQNPAVVNAFYNPNTNDIVLPAGIWQPIFYSHHFPKSMNFGGIGVVIGHEITHGFDDKGRQYDKDGNLRQWWSNRTIEAFRERGQCMIDQYSGYKLEPLGLHIDGRSTQGENIADNGGLKQSFRAYQNWVKVNGQEPQMPGINLTHNQLFFLNYAQIWCGLVRDEEALQKLRTGVHSPGPIRVEGPLSNSYDFAEAYNCPVGSRMNPVKKCAVW